MNKRVYNRTFEEEITMREALTILKRSRAYFFQLKKDNRIAPIAIDGNRFLYSRIDIINLRNQLVEYIR